MKIDRRKFLTNRDQTGRMIVESLRTGRQYWIEAIGNPHTKWGSIDPATKKLVNKKGAGKYRGSIDEEDSLITEDNGFDKITTLDIGQSPMGYIENIDSQYPDKICDSGRDGSIALV